VKKLLIVTGSILAVGPFKDDGDSISTPEIIFPKHVIDGYEMVDVELPPDFSLGAYLWDGAKVVPAPPPAPRVPESVPMLDARLTLIAAGKMAAVRAYLDALPGVEGQQAREYFEFALTMKRNHPLVQGIPPEIMTEAEKDDLFIKAGELNA
jgi:hypothetical protein